MALDSKVNLIYIIYNNFYYRYFILANYSNIRLSKFEIDTIIAIFKEYFAASDHLWIFGSRINSSARGGDIDLYVNSLTNNISDLLNNKIKFLVKLQSIIGEQKIDVILDNGRDQLPIYQIARQGIKLV